MNPFFKITSLACFVFLMACAKTTSSESASGPSDRCPNEVINTLNQIWKPAKTLDRKKDEADLKNACDQFVNLMGQGSCKGPSEKGRWLEVNAHSASGYCPEPTDASIPGPVATEPAPQPQPDPAAPGGPTPQPQPLPSPVKLKDLKNGFEIIVRDADRLNELLNSDSEAVIQEGRIFHRSIDLLPKKSLCKAEKHSDFGDVKAGDVWILREIASMPDKLTITNLNQNLGFACGKESVLDWTLADLIEIFGSTATVQAVP